ARQAPDRLSRDRGLTKPSDSSHVAPTDGGDAPPMSASWETSSRAAPTTSVAPVTTPFGNAWPSRTWVKARTMGRPRGELGALIVVAAVLNMWALSKNGWANDYYSAGVRSMSSIWHNSLYASADPSGVRTVDKPPLALWVQSLSVRVFGYHPLSMLLPQ